MASSSDAMDISNSPQFNIGKAEHKPSSRRSQAGRRRKPIAKPTAAATATSKPFTFQQPSVKVDTEPVKPSSTMFHFSKPNPSRGDNSKSFVFAKDKRRTSIPQPEEEKVETKQPFSSTPKSSTYVFGKKACINETPAAFAAPSSFSDYFAQKCQVDSGRNEPTVPPPPSTNGLSFVFNKYCNVENGNTPKKEQSSTFEAPPPPVAPPSIAKVNLSTKFQDPVKLSDTFSNVSTKFSFGTTDATPAAAAAAKKKPAKKKPQYVLCPFHAMNASMDISCPVIASCRDCSVTFKSVFVHANLCTKCHSQSFQCPISKCKCTVEFNKAAGTQRGAKCRCTTDKTFSPGSAPSPLSGRRVLDKQNTRRNRRTQREKAKKADAASKWLLHREAGKTAYQKFEYSKAIGHYTSGIEKLQLLIASPLVKENIALMLTNRAAAQMALLSFDAAISDCTAAIESCDSYSKAYHRLIRCYLLVGSYLEAIRLIPIAEELNETTNKMKNAAAYKTVSAEIKAVKDQCLKLRNASHAIESAKKDSDVGSVLESVNVALQVASYCNKYWELKVTCLLTLERYPAVKTFCEEIISNALSMAKKDTTDKRIYCKILGAGVSVAYAKSLHYLECETEANSVLAALQDLCPTNIQVVKVGRLWSEMSKLKQRGNAAFSHQRYEEAISIYGLALSLDKTHHSYCAVIYGNRAAAYMALQKYGKALDDIQAALLRKEKYPKARLRKARCHVLLKQYSKAMLDFDLYLQMVPNDTEVIAEKAEARAIWKHQQRSEKHQDYKRNNARRHSQRQQSSSRNNGYSWDDSNAYNHTDWKDFFQNQRGENSRSRRQSGGGQNNHYYNRSNSSSSSSRTSSSPGGASSSSSKSRTYYEIIGVSSSATLTEIKKAYRKLALKYHPDKAKDDAHAELFKDMTHAYTTLSDEDLRRQYDRSLRVSGYGRYYEY